MRKLAEMPHEYLLTGRVRSRTPGNACAPSLDLKSRRPTGDETLPPAILMSFRVVGKVSELLQQALFVIQAAQVEVEHAVVYAPDQGHRHGAQGSRQGLDLRGCLTPRYRRPDREGEARQAIRRKRTTADLALARLDSYAGTPGERLRDGGQHAARLCFDVCL